MLSIDVGIKNLGYCFLDMKTKQIQQWGVIDLRQNEECVKHICEFCSKLAFVSYQNRFYCKTHMNQSITKPQCVVKDNHFSKLKVSQLEEIESFILKHKVDPIYIAKKRKTKMERIQFIQTHYQDVCCIQVNKKPTSSDQFSLITLAKNLKQHFDALYFPNLETVIIENQVSPIASRMKTLQGMIVQYFIMKECYTEKLNTFEFVSSQNKLKDFAKDLTYKERKAKAVEICLHLLTTESQGLSFLELFNKSSKKDDLADCFLQGYCYLQNKKTKALKETNVS